MTAHGFIHQHTLWTEEQAGAAARLRAEVEQQGLEVIRVSWPDQYGLLRGKYLTRDAFLASLVDGTEITMAPFFFDTANAIAFNPFMPGGGFNMPELSGSPNVVMVPDPITFKVLPWAERTGWVLCDLYLRSGQPFPFAPRTLYRNVLADVASESFEFVAGLEVEWYLTQMVDPSLDPEGLGAPGFPAQPPVVLPVAKGYSYLAEHHLDEIDHVVQPLRRHLQALGLPLRSFDDEWAPSQVETTFDVLTGMAAADAATLFRSATKQICRRLGYIASFMCKPAIPGFYSSGWHLHTSLNDTRTGHNLFVPSEGQILSDLGRHYVGGTLAHAAASSAFATPTVNGYHRRRPFSLAPDRVTWGFDNRAAMVRVLSNGPGDQATHVENRIGEPAANPYLYMAAQAAAGLDGIRNRIDPGPPSEDPYADTDRAHLPASLTHAIEQLEADTFYRQVFGERFVDYFTAIKRCELARFDEHVKQHDDPEEYVKNVTEWEHREYFELF
jgi:glutamine synthetase